MRSAPPSATFALVLIGAGCFPARGSYNRSTEGPIDSAHAVTRALGALKKAVRDPDTAYKVLEFTRDEAGVVVYLAPLLPQGTLGGGGGGRVRVWNNGRTKALELGM